MVIFFDGNKEKYGIKERVPNHVKLFYLFPFFNKPWFLFRDIYKIERKFSGIRWSLNVQSEWLELQFF